MAASTKWWGEALRVAERWAKVDDSQPAQLHLARIQKRFGQVEKAVTTLKSLLARHPDDEQALMLLQLYTGTTVALR